MAKNLGTYGTARPANDGFTFGWFGMDVRVADGFGEVTFIDWMDEYGDVEQGTARGLLALVALLRGLVHEDDFDEFWRLAKENRQNSADFSALIWGVVEGLADRPTEQSEPSSPGPAPSEEESTVTFLRRQANGRPDIEAGLVETAIERGELVV